MTIYDEIRAKTGLSVMALAKQLKVSRQALYGAANGHCSRELRLQLAVMLDKSPELLFDYDNVPQSYQPMNNHNKMLLDTALFNERVQK